MKIATRTMMFVALCIAGALIAALLLPSCAGAPHSLDDLATMEQPRYDSWKVRFSGMFREASKAYSADHGPQTMMSLASALRVYLGTPTSGALSSLAGQYDGLVNLALLELGALVDENVGNADALPRVADLVAAIADAIVVGATSPP